VKQHLYRLCENLGPTSVEYIITHLDQRLKLGASEKVGQKLDIFLAAVDSCSQMINAAQDFLHRYANFNSQQT